MTSGPANRPLRHSRVVIDRQALRDNYAFLRSRAPASRVIAVIKADAYGHGAVEVARALADADAFAVATVMEALQLRAAGIDRRILVLGGVIDRAEMQDCIDARLDPVIHQDWQLRLLAEADRHHSVDIWLKFNSDMGRLGFDRPGLEAALAFLLDLRGLGKIRLMSHLANADDRKHPASRQQMARIDALGLEDYEWGVANSAAILAWPAARRHWVRAGIALYGADPMLDAREQSQLKPAMCFESCLLAVNRLGKGQPVGYGGRHVCPQDMTVGVVAAGYADGYPRHLEGGRVVINGRSAPVIGRVSMDMVTVDLEGIDARPGDRVILWGDDPLAIEVARQSETIAYELFCHAGCHAARQGRRDYRG